MTSSVLIFLLVLSVLIFVHELGHFLAAKACNVYVDRFSIGMPPRIIGFKYGETDYCIGALPFGGFVKMAGQEDSPLSEEERERDYGGVPPDRWFNNKPVWQRIIILVAGPFMNLVLAAVLYAGLFAWGVMVPEAELSARIGDIEKESPAIAAPMYREKPGAGAADYTGTPDAVGWKAGDQVIAMDGHPVDKFIDVAMNCALGGEGKQWLLTIDRPNADGTTTRYMSPATPKLVNKDDTHPRFGVAPFSSALVGGLMEGMPAATSGLKDGDVIERLNAEPVDSQTFVARVEKAPEDAPLILNVLRGTERHEITVTPKSIGRISGARFDAADGATGDAAESSQPVVAVVTDEFKTANKLQRKDVIAKINGEPATIKLLHDLERSSPNGTLKFEVERPAIMFGLIQGAETLALDIPVAQVRAVGISLKPMLIFHRTPPGDVLGAAFAQAKKDVSQTVETIVALVRRDVSMKDIGGPVMIFSVTSAAAEQGLGTLLKIMAFISVNLAVFNLIPLPILDGGQIVINLVEAIRRRPVSPAFLERYQMAGLFLIVLLMLFVTWNDVSRLVTSLTP